LYGERGKQARNERGKTRRSLDEEENCRKLGGEGGGNRGVEPYQNETVRTVARQTHLE